MIPIRRRYWQCRCGAPGAYAADAVLGLDGRTSRVVQKHCCRLAADTSFAATGEYLRELLGVRLAAETVRTVVEAHGAVMTRFQANDPVTEQAFVAAAGAVEFAVDAGKVNPREVGWKDLKIAVISKRPGGAVRAGPVRFAGAAGGDDDAGLRRDRGGEDVPAELAAAAAAAGGDGVRPGAGPGRRGVDLEGGRWTGA